LAWVVKRGRFYIRAGVGRSVSLISTGTAKRDEAEVSLKLFRSDPEGFLKARKNSPWEHPMVAHRPRNKGIVYFIGCDAISRVKIGFAGDSIKRRMKELQCGSPVELSLLATAEGGLLQEQIYHLQFAEYRLHGEWFERSPEIEAEIERLKASAP
jgi:hypothetical protein